MNCPLSPASLLPPCAGGIPGKSAGSISGPFRNAFPVGSVKDFVKGAASTLALALLLSAGAVSADPFRPGTQDQIALGKRAMKQVEKEYKVLPETDPRVQEVRRIGKALVDKIPADERKRRPFEYQFNVIEDKTLNAFALPGGPVYINTGILQRCTTEDMLAGIIAHEIIHVRNQHWASAYADNSKRQLGITAVLMILGAGSTAFDVAGVADSVLFTLPYSRKHENEADTQGYNLMVEAGWNPQGIVDLMQVLLAASGSQKDMEWASTHPDPANRVKALQKRVSESKVKFPAQKPRRVS